MIVIESSHIPPSVNTLFRNPTSGDRVRGRIRTKKYSEWLKAAQADFAYRGHIPGNYRMVITLDGSKVRKNSDISNRIKAVEDLCVHCGLVEDDSRCHSLLIQYGLCELGMRVEIEGLE